MASKLVKKKLCKRKTQIIKGKVIIKTACGKRQTIRKPIKKRKK